MKTLYYIVTAISYSNYRITIEEFYQLACSGVSSLGLILEGGNKLLQREMNHRGFLETSMGFRVVGKGRMRRKAVPVQLFSTTTEY